MVATVAVLTLPMPASCQDHRPTVEAAPVEGEAADLFADVVVERRAQLGELLRNRADQADGRRFHHDGALLALLAHCDVYAGPP